MTSLRKAAPVLVLAFIAAIGALIALSGPRRAQPTLGPAVDAGPAEASVKRRLLFIDSYHEGYPWSEGILQGALATLGVTRAPDGQLDDSKSSVSVMVTRMDTKRNASEEFRRAAGEKVKALIESWKPDIVIAADDNASKYVIVPSFRDKDLPFVFCGVNWDASIYGFPARNVTGMVEVSLIPSMLDVLKPFAHGSRVGILGAKNESNQKEVDAYRKNFKLDIEEIALVDDFEAWKSAYKSIQEKVDLLILAPPSFLAASAETADKQVEAKKFVLENTKIPTGSVEDWIAPYSLVTFAKRASEQGEWAARTALKILAGAPPASIDIVTNKQASVFLNMPLARKMGVKFPVELIEQAKLVDEK